MTDKRSMFLVLILVFSFAIPCKPQKVPGTKIMGIPLVFIIPENASEEENIMSIMPGTAWKVYTAKMNTHSYSYHDKKTIKEKLPFLETLYVTNIHGDMLYVFNDPTPDLANCVLSSQAREIGWVEKSDCLLWRHCLINPTTKQSIQAMSLSQTGLLDMEEDKESEGVNVFFDSELTLKSPVKAKVKQLYCIYKINTRSALIGFDKRIGTEENVKDVILGWIPLNYCFIPGNRIWIAPNHDPEAVSEQNTKLTFPTALTDESKAKLFQSGQKVNKSFIIWEDTTVSNYPPDWFRFPLLSINLGIAKVKIVEKDFVTAYAPMEVSGFTNPLFEKVTLISSSELSDVISNMNKIVEAGSSNNQRRSIQQVIISLLENEYSGLEEERIYNLTLKRIFENLFWVCNSNSPVVSYSFNNLLDPQILSNELLGKTHNELKIKAKGLANIMSKETNRYSFLSNNIRYYWIPIQQFY